ncbi:adenylate/guanylate cyclase domain-containing protein [Spiractinospora alimapuensis]|uniref:adenylate/guanylate cyclase domain-containing protein n=1 Tax=Spiractinospora alimapuensis TaxID=2820884 RepID=UPI001F37A3D5|nr:adenylate/guanylate cyclase domain-containing protein [Spiractinospora alimapuensis]QVQ51148.1 adenylate/guanylate cyclase domain-containing protein [Spiractinospora alimapuensis]
MSPRSDKSEIDSALLGGPARYTRDEAVARSGVSPDLALRLWRALGFAAKNDGQARFTDADVEALRTVSTLLDAGVVDEEAAVRLARAMGQSLARMAEWQVSVLATLPDSEGGGSGAEEIGPLPARAKELLPAMESLMATVWRRQMAAAASRTLSAWESAKDDTAPNYYPMVVGFADLVSYTTLSRDLDEIGLAALVEEFEGTSADLVSESGGRLVKTLGDEILYAAGTAEAAAEIALRLAEGIKTHAGVPDIRVGLAYGPVLAVLGDVFGTTVNRASRLTSFAQPGTILADQDVANLLKGDARYELVGVRERHAHGLGRIRPYVLRRGADGR